MKNWFKGRWSWLIVVLVLVALFFGFKHFKKMKDTKRAQTVAKASAPDSVDKATGISTYLKRAA